MDCRTALQTILDQVDYTAGNCRVNEMIGAVLPKEIIVLARQAIAESTAHPAQQEEDRCKCKVHFSDMNGICQQCGKKG